MSLDIDSGCKTALKHLRNPFPAIYHHSGRYRQLYQKSKFWPKSRFLRFSRIFDFSRYGRPYGRKCSNMRSGAGNGLSESPKHLYIPWMTFNDDEHIIFCHVFPCGPTRENRAKNMTFHDFS